MNINRRKQSTSPLTFSFVLPLNVNLNLNCFFPVYPSIYYNSILIVVTNLTQLRVESERERMSNARCALYSTNSAILVSLLRSKFMFQFSWYFLWFLICFSPFFHSLYTITQFNQWKSVSWCYLNHNEYHDQSWSRFLPIYSTSRTGSLLYCLLPFDLFGNHLNLCFFHWVCWCFSSKTSFLFIGEHNQWNNINHHTFNIILLDIIRQKKIFLSFRIL